MNCPADKVFYTQLCCAFGVRDNGVLYGASWADESLPSRQMVDGSVIFFEQTQLIIDGVTADKVVTQLIGIIQSKPSRRFIYKTRNNIHNEHLLYIRKQVQALPNVVIAHELSQQDIAKASEYLSISSSAIIEGLLQGKQCYLLSDEYLDDDNREIFGGSGIFLDNLSSAVSQNWLAERVHMPSEYVELQDIEKQCSIRFPKRGIRVIVWRLMGMCLYYPKLCRIALDRVRLKAVWKSLEYLDGV